MDTHHQAGKLETRGIEPIPVEECTGHPLQLFWVWFAANLSILGLPLGATLIFFQHLSIIQVIITAILGAGGSFAAVGLISIAGKRGHAPSLTLSRAIFGVRGNILPTVVSLLSRVGWETVNSITATFVLLSLCSIVSGVQMESTDYPIVTLIALLIFVFLTLCVSGLGHSTLLVIQKWASYLFGILNLVVCVFMIPHISWSHLWDAPSAPLSHMIIGIGIIAAGTGIGWANAGADISRYQNKASRSSSLVAVAAFGAGIPLVILITLGSMLTVGDSSLASASDPIAAIRHFLPGWMAVPYLIAAFGGLLMSNNLSVYSAGLTTLTLGLKVKRVYAVVIDILVILSGGIYFTLVTTGFYGPFISFISLLAIPINAWVGIFLIDLLHRKYYSPEDLINTQSSSRYWYSHGIEWRAVSSWILAIVLGYSFMTVTISGNNLLFQGWLSNTWIGQNGMGWVVSLVVSGGLYALLGGNKDRQAAHDLEDSSAI